MSRYLIIVHKWHVDSKGFNTKEIEAANDDAAYAQGLLFENQFRGSFTSTAFKVIPLAKTERINKLTFKERFFGRLLK